MESALSQRPKQLVVHPVATKLPVAPRNQFTTLFSFQSPVSPSKNFSVDMLANISITFQYRERSYGQHGHGRKPTCDTPHDPTARPPKAIADQKI